MSCHYGIITAIIIISSTRLVTSGNESSKSGQPSPPGSCLYDNVTLLEGQSKPWRDCSIISCMQKKNKYIIKVTRCPRLSGYQPSQCSLQTNKNEPYPGCCPALVCLRESEVYPIVNTSEASSTAKAERRIGVNNKHKTKDAKITDDVKKSNTKHSTKTTKNKNEDERRKRGRPSFQITRQNTSESKSKIEKEKPNRFITLPSFNSTKLRLSTSDKNKSRQKIQKKKRNKTRKLTTRPLRQLRLIKNKFLRSALNTTDSPLKTNSNNKTVLASSQNIPVKNKVSILKDKPKSKDVMDMLNYEFKRKNTNNSTNNSTLEIDENASNKKATVLKSKDSKNSKLRTKNRKFNRGSKNSTTRSDPPSKLYSKEHRSQPAQELYPNIPEEIYPDDYNYDHEFYFVPEYQLNMPYFDDHIAESIASGVAVDSGHYGKKDPSINEIRKTSTKFEQKVHKVGDGKDSDDPPMKVTSISYHSSRSSWSSSQDRQRSTSFKNIPMYESHTISKKLPHI